jgi:hypothetical protein
MVFFNEIAVGHATLGRIGFEGPYDYGALGQRHEPRLAAQRRGGTSAAQPVLAA